MHRKIVPKKKNRKVIHQDSTDRGVLMDQQYHRRMVGLRQSVHPKEVVIGWFSCGDSDITDDTVFRL